MGVKPLGTFGTMPFCVWKMSDVNREGTTKKGHFCSFAEEGSGLDPRNLPLVAHLRP